MVNDFDKGFEAGSQFERDRIVLILDEWWAGDREAWNGDKLIALIDKDYETYESI